MNSEIVLILGGARSGKSRFALNLASSRSGRKAFLATAQPGDEEMQGRIARHRRERAPAWATFEEPLAIPSLLRELALSHQVLLVDCLTLWVSNLLHDEAGGLERNTGELIRVLGEVGPAHVFLVSNEVGMGIVPETALARRFQDEAGRLHQTLAALAAEVYLVTAGIPLRLK